MFGAGSPKPFLSIGSGKMKSPYLRHNDAVLPQALSAELQELSFPVNQELDTVKWIVANPPEEVPEQLLKALEKDAKNLQKSLSSASDVLESRLQNLRGAAETEKVELAAVPAASRASQRSFPGALCSFFKLCISGFKAKILAHHETLQGKLQELLSWVSGTAESLDGGDYHHTTDVNSLSRCLQHYKVTMAMPLILLADEVAVLYVEEKLLILLPSWSLQRVCPYILRYRRSNNIVICSKVICFHNTQTTSLAVWGTC